MRVNMMSLSPKRMRVRTILWLVFSIVLLSSIAGRARAMVVVHASSMGTLQLLSDINGDGVARIWDPRASAIFDLPQLTKDSGQAYTDFKRLWSDDSYWYKKIPEDGPLHPNNDQMINWLVTYHAKYPGIQWQSWTNVVYNCYEDTHLYSVYNEDHSRYESIPFPEPYPVDIPSESDHAVTIIDWYREKVWDLWNVRAQDDTYIAGDAWELPLYGSGLDDTGVGGEWTSGGSGCPSVAYLIRPEEIEAGVINHVIGCALRSLGPYTDGSRFDSEEGFVHPPAVHTDRETTSSNPNQIPAGARIQLDPAINLNALGLSTTGKIIAKALQDYGMVVAESGGSWHIYAEHDLTADWNPPEMSGNLMSTLGDLATSKYNPWRIVDYSVFGASLF